MAIIEPAIRPPAEAESFLLQVTTGCSSNGCTFCGAYLDKPFRIKSEEEVFSDIEQGGICDPETRRVFLMDGDALAVKRERLLPILKSLQKAFPKLSRVASYANGYNITRRSDEELKELFEHKLSLIYLGLESGAQTVLDRCRKKSTADEMVEAVIRADRAGIKSSVIVLLGLGGKNFSAQHIQDTIKALNRMQPRYLSFLTVMLIPGTPLYHEAREGVFEELSSADLLKEAYAILEGLKLDKTIFRSNHASNYLALEGRFPQDRERLLKEIQSAVLGRKRLRPEGLRGL